MKKILTRTTIAIFSFLPFAKFSYSQCGANYTSSSINWDLQYNNGGYNIGSTGARFAIGINSLLISTSGTVTSSGPNATHTGNGGISVNGSSDPTSHYDACYSIGNGTITFTFETELQNVSFSIYDLDNGQTVSVLAKNSSNTSQNISMAAIGSTNIGFSGNNSSSATATGPSGGIGNSSNNAAFTISVASSVKTITLSFTKASGSDNIWISDITACTNGTYPNNYYSIAAPENSQAEYFLVARSNSLNIVNATTGNSSLLYTDASLAGINSLAYDALNQIVYYTSEEYVANNKTIYKYNVKTGAKTTFISDVTASPYNMILSEYGLGSGGATFYNNSLFIGFEASAANSMAGVYRIDLDSTGNPTTASRVIVKKGADGNGQLMGFGDFVANGTNFYLSDNASSNGFQIYNLNEMTLTNNYSNYPGQLSISSNGTPRFVDNSPAYGSYTGSGTWASATTINNSTGSITNDASEVFKYPADYGDAPASYGISYHVFAIPSVLNLYLGSTIDYEVNTVNTDNAQGDDVANGGSSDDEDAIVTLPDLNTSSSTYSVNVAVNNSQGSAASLYGWIDFNRNGIFESGERAGSSGNVANNSTSVTLTWSSISGLVAGQSYLRIRIGSVNNEVNTPSGKAINGETEDYSISIKLSICGTLFNDANGMTESTPTIDGVGIGLPSSTQLYAYLVDNNTMVSQKITLPSNGIYAFSNVELNSNYSIKFSSNSVAIGSTAPTNANLPTDWVCTGECYGNNNSAGSGNETGNPNGNISIITSNSNITGLNFGIQKISSAYTKTYSGLNSSSFGTTSGNSTFPNKISLNASSGTQNGIVNSSSSSTLPGKLSGIDNEDGNYGGTNGSSGSRTVVFTTLPNINNDVLVYNNGSTNILLVPSPTAQDASYAYWNVSNSRYEIANFNINNLSVYFKPNGHSSFSFNYAWIDAAGFLGNAATYSVSATSPLPMKLLYFGAELENNSVSLKWMTTNEFNIENYFVQKSTDMKIWNTISSKLPLNNYSDINTYFAFDATNSLETVYYRIMEKDFDGSIYYSNEVAVSNTFLSPSLKIFPNPATNNEILNIEIQNQNRQEMTVRMTDQLGKEIQLNNYSGLQNHLAIPLINIESGIYFISVSNSTFTQTQKIVIK